MPRIIEGGIQAFQSLAYDAPTDNMMTHLRGIAEDYDRRLTGRARDHFHGLRERVKTPSFRDIKRRVTATMRKLGQVWASDMIQELETLGQFQHPPQKMRQYIMSEPSVRERFYKQRCEGYADEYVDRFPGQIGDDDPVYRSVMDGILQEDEDGNCFYMDYDTDYQDEMVEQLEVEEKDLILRTQERLRYFMNKGLEDPTSQYNAQL